MSEEFPLAKSILPLLEVPIVVVFTGHVIDAPGRRTPRFPVHLGAVVKARIDAMIEDEKIGIGYCSPACGADILFIECMQKRDREVQIILPFKRDDFVKTSVAFAGNHWVRRFRKVMALAEKKHCVRYCVNEDYLGDASLFAHAGTLIQGLALLHANELGMKCKMLAVMEPEADPKIGGTAYNVAAWKKLGRKDLPIDLKKIREQVTKSRAANPATITTSGSADATILDTPSRFRLARRMTN